MKTRQRSVRIFEIITENYEKFKKFATTREVTLKKFLVVVRTENEKIKEFLKSAPFEYRVVRPDFEASNEKIEGVEQVVTKKNKKEAQKSEKKESTPIKTEIFDRIIRGGEEINSDNHLIFLKRINPGAKIVSTNSIEIFDEVRGVVICTGDYMIVKKNRTGTILFHSEEIKVDRLSLITKEGIKEL